MDPQLINKMVGLISSHGYWYMFLAMLVEGPIVTIAGAFASALGFFNPYLVFLVSIPGDLVADIAYYFMGYWLREAVVDRFVEKFGVGKKQIENLEKLLEKHTWSTLMAIKLSPFLPTPGLMIVGNSKISFKKYITVCLYIIIPKSIIFVLLGYYAGFAGGAAAKYLQNYQLLLVIALVAIAIIYWGYNKISFQISRKFQKF